MTACRQPRCTGVIVDGYCDVCGTPAVAAPFAPAASAASARLSTDCTQPGCTGTIVDGYCDVCGSAAGAAPFISAAAAASAVSSTPADEPGLAAVRGSTPASAPADQEIPTHRIPRGTTPRQQLSTGNAAEAGPVAADVEEGDAAAPVDEGMPTLFDLRWSPETTDSIDIPGSGEVKATLRRLTEPAAAAIEKGHTAQAEPAAAAIEKGHTAQAEPAAAAIEKGHTAQAEPAAAAIEKGHTAQAEPVVADVDEADASPAGPEHDDKVKMPAVSAVSSGGREQRPQLPEQGVLGPEPVQTPAEKRRFGSLALVAIALVALLIGALLFAATRDRDVTAQSVPTVTATATATVSKPTSEPSDKSTNTEEEESTIQLDDLADSGRPFQPVRIHGTYRGGADTFLRVQRWEGGKWVTFPVPTKTNQSGKFTAHVELGTPGRYRLRVLDPNSGVASKPFVLVIQG